MGINVSSVAHDHNEMDPTVHRLLLTCTVI